MKSITEYHPTGDQSITSGVSRLVTLEYTPKSPTGEAGPSGIV